MQCPDTELVRVCIYNVFINSLNMQICHQPFFSFAHASKDREKEQAGFLGHLRRATWDAGYHSQESSRKRTLHHP